MLKKKKLGAKTTQQGKNLCRISEEETLPPNGLQEKVVAREETVMVRIDAKTFFQHFGKNQ